MKRLLIGILIFVLYLALVIAAAFALHFTGSRAVLFCLILGILGATAVGFTLWYLHRLDVASGQVSSAGAPDALDLHTLLHEADARIRGAGRADASSMAAMPLIYVIGDENSAKTQTVLQSGLDSELLAGAVYRDQAVAPTQLANVWLASNCVLVEAGGAMLRQPALWQQLIKATMPSRIRSALSKNSRMPARSVLVCVSIERILAPNTTEQIRALAQTLNERLRQLSRSLGVSLPVYVLFTKIDTIAPFADFARHLSQDEIREPVGAMLAIGPNTGLYTEQATALISSHFDRLIFSLAEFRLDLFPRGGELQELARAYEFPRDLRKVRAGIVSFLVEVARPSQIAVNPFLRGFFFTGMRAHLVEDVLDVGPAQAQASAPVYSGATRIFSVAGGQTPQAPAPSFRRGGTRKVPQWVFLPHLFSRILLADKSALDASSSSTRTHVLRRVLLASASAAVLVLFLLATVSFFNNRSLEQRVASAAATPVSAVAAGTIPARSDLETLDRLRAVMTELDGYRKDGAPLLYRIGLYRGNELDRIACQAYGDKFHTLLLAPVQANMVSQFNALPATPSPDADYSAAYRPLKAYLITVSNPNPDSPQDTAEFLPAALFEEWVGNTSPDPDVARLARAQFAFYANQLAAPSSCMADLGGQANNGLVARTRAYLNGFQGFQHVYQSMLAAANRKVPGFDFNSKYPGSAQYIVDNYPIPGAFSKDGFTFMQNAILHPDQYLGGEEWVLGPSNSAPIDPAALVAQLKSAYFNDYIQTWRTYLNRAEFQSYRSFPDAASKLGALDSNTSALLELFSLVSVNTGVAAPEIATAFQAPQSIVPPNSPDNRLLGSSNQAYIQALQGLEGAIKNLTLNPASANDPAAAGPITQAATSADQAAENLRNAFVPDAAGGMDKTSFRLLEAPIVSAMALSAQVPAQAASGAAKNFCSQLVPLLAKFPFNPQASQEASPEEVAQVFAPGQGSFAQLYNASLHALIAREGSEYVPAPGSAVKINPVFLSFLDKAQRIGTSLFPAGGNQPSLDFSLTEVKAPGTAEAVLSIDGKQIQSEGQSAAFHWVSQPASRITLATQKNTAPAFTGPWSIFHFAFAALPQVSPNRLKFSFNFNNQAPEIVLFDASGPGSPLLNPEFMRGFRCVSSVAR